MNDSPLLNQIKSLPDLIDSSAERFAADCADIARNVGKTDISEIFLTGCGDSHHAAVATRLAFQQFAAIPSYALTAMELSRYQFDQINLKKNGLSLVMAISSSGQVSRTIEALAMAKASGAITVAITGDRKSELAGIADFVLSVTDNFETLGKADVVVPGTRSYYLSLLALFHFADQLAVFYRQTADRPSMAFIDHAELISELARGTINVSIEIVTSVSASWRGTRRFVFCGSGPNYGTAMYSAAKIIEASGDAAVAQDLEEWAHLQYFERDMDTPTIVISAGKADRERALEIITAARTIGRQIAVIAPATDQFIQIAGSENMVPLAGQITEAWSPLLTALPGLLLAANRSNQLKEQYFRDFSGGRNRSGGGGISRIRTSHRIDQQET